MKIALLRKEMGLTQTDLAEKCETTQQQIARLERGLVDPKLSTLGRIAAALKCELPDLFFTPREFEARVNQTIIDRNLNMKRTPLVELSSACAEDHHISCFDPLWERAEVVNSRIRIQKEPS